MRCQWELLVVGLHKGRYGSSNPEFATNSQGMAQMFALEMLNGSRDT